MSTLITPETHGIAHHAAGVRVCQLIRRALEPFRGDPAVDAFFARCDDPTPAPADRTPQGEKETEAAA